MDGPKRRGVASDDPAAKKQAQTGSQRHDATHDPAGDTGETHSGSSDTPARSPAPRTAAPKAAQTPEQASADQKLPTDKLGDFLLIKKLGEGGMGQVYLAHQVSLDRDVALKMLSPRINSQKAFVERFYREARTMAKLDHPNIVRGYAVGEADGIHHVAMELIDGQTMQDWLKKLGKLEVGDVVHIGIRVSDALQHAHELNLIHRDIKPDNMLVTRRGVLKVSDLGLAKNLDEDNSMTQSGTGMGTPYYMPPEQARNAKYVDARSDIYALGSTLYHFLAGDYPFRAESTLELILAKEKGKFAPVRRLNPKVPERLELMIDKMMATDPKHRYQTCAEVLKDLTSLGIASETLSFITDAAPAARLGSGPASVAARPATALPSTAKTGMGKPGAKPVAADAKKASAPANVWYVVYPGADGKIVKGQFSTEQLLQLIRSEQIDVRTKACKTKTGEYLPLAQFPEFSSSMNQRLIKANAEKKSVGVKGIYEELDRQDRSRRRWRWFRNATENMRGVLGLILYLLIVAVVLAGGFYAVRTYIWPAVANTQPAGAAQGTPTQ